MSRPRSRCRSSAVTDRTPIVVKIGGGLLRAEGVEGLRRACVEAAELAATQPVLVVPGGGPFADAVRTLDAQVGLDDALAHALAIQAMDQLGTMLAPLLPGAETLTELVRPRSIGLLVAAPAFAGRPEIPESWAVTSDSLAVLAAGAIGAEEAVLLTPAAGVPAPGAQLTAAELQALQDTGAGGAVDLYLPEAVRRTGVTVIVRTPGSGSASGTRITRG
jgi:5-(aminomethyl)-3-furanmethanol phosphate kinase